MAPLIRSRIGRIIRPGWSSGKAGLDLIIRPVELFEGARLEMRGAAPTIEVISLAEIYDPGFEITTYTFEANPAAPLWDGGAWYSAFTVGFAAVDRFGDASIDGTYVARVRCTGTSGTFATSNIRQVLSPLLFDATPNLTFKVRPLTVGNAAHNGAYITLGAYDSGKVAVHDGTNALNALKLWGASVGTAIDTTTIIIPAPDVNTVYTRTFDLKTWLSARLLAGKTWADVAYILLGGATFHGGGVTSAISARYDSFSTS